MARRRTAKRTERRDMRKGIYILPNLVTSGSILFGFWSLVLAAQGRYEIAAHKILWCFLFDGLDGSVARLTRSTSKFGVEYDSLADVVSFGVAPAFLVYSWGLNEYGRYGWLTAFLFLVAGAVRLARFNVQTGTVDPKRFVGLPIPAGALVITSTILLAENVAARAASGLRSPVVVILVLALAALMVSTIPYRNHKQFDLRSRQPVWLLFPLLAVVMALVAEFELAAFVITVTYMLSGPIELLIRNRSHRDEEASGGGAASGRAQMTVLEGGRAGQGAAASPESGEGRDRGAGGSKP